jgi:5-methylcytosine-specific restriction protein A
MKNIPKKPCNHAGCTNFKPCPIHFKKTWQHSKEIPRLRGWKLAKARKQLFDEQPLCVMCLKKGIVNAATQRDHIVPLAEGGADTSENTQGLCQNCHKLKTAEESKRGMLGR